MKFSKNYKKLNKEIFTTIRRNKGYYRFYQEVNIKTPSGKFKARVIGLEILRKEDITEELANKDADCSKQELINMLEKWYGKKYDNYVLLLRILVFPI